MKRAEAEDVADFRIQAPDGSSGECGDDMIERALPPERPRGDLARERTIALVLQRGARAREGRRQVGFAIVHGAQDVVRGDPGWRDHQG